MFEGTNLFWFGALLEAGLIFTIVTLFRPAMHGVDEQLAMKLKQLKQDYQTLQQESQQQKARLTQDCARLRQELQQQNDRLLQEHLRYQREWQQQQQQLLQERDRLQQQLEALSQERDRLQQQLGQCAETGDRLQQENFTLQAQLQQQAKTLKNDVQIAAFKQLETLLVNYPSASKIAQAKPNLPATTLTSMFAPLEKLLQSWGYEAIGQVWENVSYDPTLHQPDSAGIQLGESVYIRFVGYRAGAQILCPAKVSRRVPSGGDEVGRGKGEAPIAKGSEEG